MLQNLRKLSKARLVCAVLALLLVLLGAYFFLAQQASRQAANIFNHFMHKQQVLVGRVTTQELRADIWGNVYFTELRWESPRGETLLEVPEGRLKIKPWDIVLRRAGISTIEEVELHKAYVHLGFDDRMRLEVLQRDAKSRRRNLSWTACLLTRGICSCRSACQISSCFCRIRCWRRIISSAALFCMMSAAMRRSASITDWS